MWKKHPWMMAEETGGDGGAGGGGTGVDGSGGNDGGAPAAAAGDQGAAQAASLLQRAEGGSEATPAEFIPEKYRVAKEDGSLDLEASSRKLAEAHGHLEKRMGSGGAPPEEPSEYQIEVPESLPDYKPSDDPGMQKFLADAHKSGMTQQQLDVVMQHYFQAVPQLAGAFQTLDMQAATDQLKNAWGADDREFKRQAGLAHVGASAAAERAGVTMEEIERAGLGNNPVFLRMMSAIGAEFKEDKGPGGGASYASFGEDDVQKLMQSEAYSNPRHPDHAKTSETIRKYYERKHGTSAVA